MAKLRIKKIKSHIRKSPNQEKNLVSLGLRKIGQERLHEDTKVIRGMLEKVKHLVSVSEEK